MAWTLVTGGAKRLGAELCFALAQAGYSIVVHYKTSQQEALAIVAKCRQLGVDAAAIQGDFSSPVTMKDFINRYLQHFEETENVIHNVGNYLTKPLLETSFDEWFELFQTNLNVPFFLSKALAPSLKKFRGNIINIGISGSRQMHATSQSPAYRMTKASLLELTYVLARELAPEHVRVNMVSPGYIDIAVDLPSDLKKIPMGRAAKCQEIIRVILFLLDRKSEYITGQNIEIAGGLNL